MKNRHSDTKIAWTSDAISNKLDELRRMCLDSERPSFFPENLSDFCNWSDESKGIFSFTRPVLYKSHNDVCRNEAQKLINIVMHRWTSSIKNDRSRISELESLTKMLASSYHTERQKRIDAQRESSALRISVESLTHKINELTGVHSLKLVK